MKPITVLLADDHTVVREGLRALLEIDRDFVVVGEAADGLQAVAMAAQLHPAVAVLDIAMPQLNGLEAARRILQEPAPPKVLILSAHSDDPYVEQVAALGVAGYLVKQSSAQHLAKAIRDIVAGKTAYSPSVGERLGRCQQESAYPGQRRKTGAAALTSRERQVLQLVAEGRANKEVASDLGISIKTVEKHRGNVMRKLDIHDTAGLTRYAISAGVIESSAQNTTRE